MEIGEFRRSYTVCQETGCWVWLCRTNGKYPTALDKSYAHRFSWEFHNEPLGDREVHHTCKNVLCVNPDHLEALSKKEHMHKHAQEILTCKYGHPWTPETTRIRSNGTRQCIPCANERSLKSYYRTGRRGLTHG